MSWVYLFIMPHPTNMERQLFNSYYSCAILRYLSSPIYKIYRKRNITECMWHRKLF